MKRISVKVPASTANLGSGYDVFGLAISIHNTFSIQESDSLSITINNNKSNTTLPIDKTNLVYTSIKTFYDYIDQKCPEFAITINCNIPLSSGMGSSSTAIVGGIALANAYSGFPLTQNDLVNLACKIEGHPDNTTAAILGGFTISATDENSDVLYKKLNWPDKWAITIAHPDFELSTQLARSVIPANVPLKDAVFNMGSCAFMVAATATEDDSLLSHALKDRLHQQYRSKLIPGLLEIQDALNSMDIYGSALSGAGPSICVISGIDQQESITKTIKTVWQQHNISCEFFYPAVDNEGIQYFS